jgi:hypothetical protein
MPAERIYLWQIGTQYRAIGCTVAKYFKYFRCVVDLCNGLLVLLVWTLRSVDTQQSLSLSCEHTPLLSAIVRRVRVAYARWN